MESGGTHREVETVEGLKRENEVGFSGLLHGVPATPDCQDEVTRCRRMRSAVCSVEVKRTRHCTGNFNLETKSTKTSV